MSYYNSCDHYLLQILNIKIIPEETDRSFTYSGERIKKAKEGIEFGSSNQHPMSMHDTLAFLFSKIKGRQDFLSFNVQTA